MRLSFQMLDVIRKDNRLDIDLKGKLDAAEMKSALNAIATKAIGIEHGKMLYRITDFHLPSFRAMAVELARMPQMLRLIRQFDRVAVIADASWIRAVSEWEGKLIEHLEIRAFPHGEQAAAEEWLKDEE